MKNWTLVLVALSLSACGGLKSEEPAPTIFRITAPVLAGGAPLAAHVLIPRPSTAPGLDTAQIATRFPGLRLDYYAGAQWGSAVSGMVQAAMIETLQGSGRLQSVQGDLGRFRSTHVLDLEVRRLEADYTAGGVPVARVTLAATLGRQSDRRATASWTVSTEVRASENRLGAVILALDAAFAQAATEVSARALDAIAEDLSRQPAANTER